MKYEKLSLQSIIKFILAAVLTSIIVFFIGIALVSCCSDDKEDSDPIPVIPPTITSFEPQHGLPGASVTITGTNFSTTLNKNAVKINGIAATVTAATATELIVTVPAATTGKVSVSIEDEEAESATDFEVLKDFPRTGLIGYYPFTNSGAEGTGKTALDFNLSLTGSPAFSADRFDKANQSLSFNGAQVGNATVQIIPEDPWTVSTWIKYTTLLNNSAFFATMSNSIGLQLHFTMRGNGLYGVSIYGGDGVNNYQLSTTTTGYLEQTTATWVNVTLTYDGATFKAYKNGIEVESRAIVADSKPGPQLLLGRSSTDQFTGWMDDLIVYGRVLSPAEVTQLYQQTASKY